MSEANDDGRWALGLALLVVASLGALLPLGGDRVGRAGTTLVADANEPAAMAALPDGGLLYGERTGGRVIRVRPDGSTSTVAGPLALATEGQRGLLGVAVDAADRSFGVWIDPSGLLLVGRVDVDPIRLVWRGPVSADLANGGRLAIDPDGSLVIGIGELQEPELVADPEAPHGKLLRLDPGGADTQRAEVIAGGWHNPFAFAFAPGGELWVADNAPGERPERLARADLGEATHVTELPPHTVPTGLAILPGGDLVLCGYGTGVLQRYTIGEGGRPEPSGLPLAGDCALGVIVLADGRLAYATEREIRVLPPPAASL